MAHDVFISYSAKNNTTADAVCAMLESNGIRCWIAPRDVVPGMEWGECIIDAIEQSRIMVLVFTAAANDSPQRLPSVYPSILPALRASNQWGTGIGRPTEIRKAAWSRS